jgi:ATP synthase protein I
LRDPISAHRRVLAQAVVPQAVATALAAVAALAFRGAPWSLGVLAGGGATLVGGWLSMRLALGGGVGPGTTALLRVLGGVLVKWVVVIAVLLAAVAWAGWPPAAVLAGALVALVAQVVALARRR